MEDSKLLDTLNDPHEVGDHQHVNEDGKTDAERAGTIGGVGGAITGLIAGSAVGPVGAVLGAAVGGIIGGFGSNVAVAKVDKHDNDNTPTGVTTPDDTETRMVSTHLGEDYDRLDPAGTPRVPIVGDQVPTGVVYPPLIPGDTRYGSLSDVSASAIPDLHHPVVGDVPPVILEETPEERARQERAREEEDRKSWPVDPADPVVEEPIAIRPNPNLF
jgi:outer membrane lipoprotein SlyB